MFKRNKKGLYVPCALVASAGGGSVAFDAFAASTAWSALGTSSHATFNITPVSGAPTLGLVFVNNYCTNGSGPPTVSWGLTSMGVAYATESYTETAPINWTTFVFGLISPPTGTQTITVSFTNYGAGSSSYGTAVAYTFTGSSLSTAFDGSAGSISTSAVATASDTIASGLASGDMAVDYLVSVNSDTYTAGGGQTAQTVPSKTASSYKAVTGSSVTMSQGMSPSDQYTHLVVAVKQ